LAFTIGHLREYTKMADEIIRELWKIKDSIADEYGCDVKALAAHLRGKKRDGDRQVVDLRTMKQAAEQQALEDPNRTGIIS